MNCPRIIFFQYVLTVVACSLVYGVSAQDQGGLLSGNFQANANFFQRDSAIGAFGTPQYDRELYGAEAWLNLNYSRWGFDTGIRFDLFNQSNLLNPQGSYTDQGIGRWFIHKKIHALDLSAGYLYDQIGSGIIFRAFEERPLLIDNALYGVRAAYELNPNWQVKAFTGRQKRQFDTYRPVVRGLAIDGFFSPSDSARWSIAPGAGVVGRSYDDATIQEAVSAITTYTPVDSIGAQYNTYAFSAYNTLTAGPVTWYVEGAYKTRDLFFDPFSPKTNWDGSETTGKLVNRSGWVAYSSLSFTAGTFGITVEGKRTENFTFRANPFVALNQGLVNFLPPMSRINTYRLTSRYNAATQELGEQAVQVDLGWSPGDKWSFILNLSDIQNLQKEQLYREFYFEATHRLSGKWWFKGGVQLQNYNQEVYEVKPGVPLVQTFTPFFEAQVKLDRRKSLRWETQAMLTGQDFGSWLFGLVEFSKAPHWTFTASNMYNFDPKKTSRPIHYPRLDVFYNYKNNRFSLSYVKQVEGVVCTGGICRLEPAFSGVKLTVQSNF